MLLINVFDFSLCLELLSLKIFFIERRKFYKCKVYNHFMENLLVNIQKYRPRENQNPKENFFTEILAFILNRDKNLLSDFVKLLGFSEEIKTYNTTTQTTHKGKAIDIEIIINGSISIFIENKIGSTVNEYGENTDKGIIVNNQLKNYIEIQKNNKKYSGHVVLLTQFSEKIEEDIKKSLKKHIYWRDVYSLFKRYNSKDGINKFLINQFVGLMEEENMEPYNKITKEMVKHFDDFLNNVEKLFEQILEELNAKLTNRSITLDFIDHYFIFKDIKFSLNYGTVENEFNLYIDRNTLSKDQDEKFQKSGLQNNKAYFWVTYPLGDDFFNMSSEEQFESLNKFFLEKIESTIGEVVLRK